MGGGAPAAVPGPPVDAGYAPLVGFPPGIACVGPSNPCGGGGGLRNACVGASIVSVDVSSTSGVESSGSSACSLRPLMNSARIAPTMQTIAVIVKISPYCIT